MFTTDNTIKVLIGKDIDITANGSVDPQSANFIADGEITILTEPAAGGGEEAYPAGGGDRTYVRLAQRSGEKVHYSPRIKVANLLKTTAAASVAAVNQVDYIGYNGAAGAIEELNNNQYLLHVTYRHDDKIWSEQLNKRTYCYYSDTTTLQQEVAADFIKQINMDAYGAISAVMVTDSVGAALTTTGQNCDVVKGSDVVTFAAPVTIATGAYIKIGGVASTTPVYKVKTGVTAGTAITLDTPYQGTTATVLDANVNTCNAIVSVGIQLTGKDLVYKPKGLAPYNRVKFETAIANFGSTFVTNATAMTWGTGLYEQIADMEWFALGGDGVRNFMWHPVPEGRTDAVAGQYYYVKTIEYYNNDDQYVISGSKPSRGQVFVFFAAGTAAAVPPVKTNYSTFTTNWNTYVPAAFHF